MDPLACKHAKAWLKAPFDLETQEEVKRLMLEDEATFSDSFRTQLSFGTGGIRSLMGVGTNRLNQYTIRFVTQGLAEYILEANHPNPQVFIAYDSRACSHSFALETARVLAGNQIRVFLTKNLRPTPYLSFGCRYLNCIAAVMITASHNPPEYNGYKVYWKDGGQVVPPHEKGIMEKVRKVVDPDEVLLANQDDPLIHYVEDEVDDAYYAALLKLQHHPATNHAEGKKLKIIYSPLHGCGITTLPEALKRWGFSSLSLVKEQQDPDPLFTEAPSPNPEDRKALQLGIDRLRLEGGDLFFATDPDADRIGVVVSHQGKEIPLSGNQIAALCLYYLCQKMAV